jgi:hypothetical protein
MPPGVERSLNDTSSLCLKYFTVMSRIELAGSNKNGLRTALLSGD